MVAIQLEHPNDNSENIRIGVEYAYLNLIFLRTGYKINVLGQKAPTFGAGFNLNWEGMRSWSIMR